MSRRVATLAPDAADQLLRHTWPGNVRELEHAMERVVALGRGSRIELEDLPKDIRAAKSPARELTGKVLSLGEMERDYILAALARNGGNQTRTAAQLKIGSATLYRKLKGYGKLGTQRTTQTLLPR